MKSESDCGSSIDEILGDGEGPSSANFSREGGDISDESYRFMREGSGAFRTCECK